MKTMTDQELLFRRAKLRQRLFEIEHCNWRKWPDKKQVRQELNAVLYQLRQQCPQALSAVVRAERRLQKAQRELNRATWGLIQAAGGNTWGDESRLIWWPDSPANK
jgi:hypothetical protein